MTKGIVGRAPDTPPLTPHTGSPNSPSLPPAASNHSQGPTPSTSGIDLYQWASPNGLRVTILLEELIATGCEIIYKEHDMPLSKGGHLQPWFTKINPSNRLPAIVDRDAEGGIPVFESPSILIYLSNKYDSGYALHFSDIRLEAEMMSWIFLIHGSLAPAQLEATHYLRSYPRISIPYAANRYIEETKKLFGVLERRLSGGDGEPRDFLVGNKFSLADIMAFTWVRTAPYTIGVPHLCEAGFPHLDGWVSRISVREATKLALEKDVYASLGSGKNWEEKSRRLVSWLAAEAVV